MKVKLLAPLFPVALVLATACSDSTSSARCNLTVQTAAVDSSMGPIDGVVTEVKVSGPGNTPEGYDPFTQLDVFISIRSDAGLAATTYDIIVANSFPVLESRGGGTPVPTSACDIRAGDRVTFWAPSDFFSVDPSSAIEINGSQLIIKRN
jgi:hypothetical protein